MYYRNLLKTGQIALPKEIQSNLDLVEGEYLFIYIFQDNIEICKHHENNTLNQCIFRNGKISIPVELRKLTGITPNSRLKVQINSRKDKILINSEKDTLIKEA
jgi:bifunctional DNA-binding transcriptional regulator/antitoxin component of YhaV-PrlF toxin-antitoxin module